MNRATLANLSNSELTSLIERNQDIERIVVDELVVRFVAMVNNEQTIKDEAEEEYQVQQQEHENEIDELRSTIREAIGILESI